MASWSYTSFGTNVVLKGDRELERKLRRLENKVAKKIVRKAVKKALLPVKRAAKANASAMVGGEMGGLLRKALIIRPFKKQRSGSFGAQVMLKGGVIEFVHITQAGERQYIPAAIEYGHVGGWHAGGKGFVPAIPFFRTTVETTLPQTEIQVRQLLARGIKAVARGG